MSEPNLPQNPMEIPPQMALLQMVSGGWVSQAIYVAAKLGIADLLKDGPKSSQANVPSVLLKQKELAIAANSLAVISLNQCQLEAMLIL
ncbi:hypothetical protein [Microseira sp. BLCC-F43]|jgi:Asp/Glu/hydantoin racemase|uniref:hypothetical protein n=1 Tax=Microseira sp. BLCC-F43 TaxID=3153602 RepID=UPI0035B773C6